MRQREIVCSNLPLSLATRERKAIADYLAGEFQKDVTRIYTHPLLHKIDFESYVRLVADSHLDVEDPKEFMREARAHTAHPSLGSTQRMSFIDETALELYAVSPPSDSQESEE